MIRAHRLSVETRWRSRPLRIFIRSSIRPRGCQPERPTSSATTRSATIGNARVILHQRAGAKMHQRREQEGPQLGALVYSWFNVEACRQMALTAFDALNGRDDSCRRSFPGYGRDG